MLKLSYKEQQRNDSPNASGCLKLIRSELPWIIGRTSSAAIITPERDVSHKLLSKLLRPAIHNSGRDQ
jgi:hypothetical protein